MTVDLRPSYRLTGPDFTKGICITLMVYGHITHIGVAKPFQDWLVSVIYSFHMPVFLMLSGALFSSSSVNKVFRQLFIPYLSMIGIYLLALIAIKYFGIQTNNLPPTSAIEFFQIILFHPKGGYWFLHTLIIIQLTFIITELTRDKVAEKPSLFSLTLACVIFLILTVFEIIAFKNIGFFILGWFLSKSITLVNKKHWAYSAAAVIMISPIFREYIEHDYFQIVWVICILSALMTAGENFSNGIFTRIFAWVGRNSLSILLFHAIFIISFKPLSKFFMSTDDSGVLYSLSVCMITIAGSLATSMALDRLKISKILLGRERSYSSYVQSIEGTRLSTPAVHVADR